MSSVSPSILEQKRDIALAAEAVVAKTGDVALTPSTRVGASYPIGPDVPGIWVYGPDPQGRFTITLSIAVAPVNIPSAAGKLRAEIGKELKRRDLASHVKAIDINVDDLMVA